MESIWLPASFLWSSNESRVEDSQAPQATSKHASTFDRTRLHHADTAVWLADRDHRWDHHAAGVWFLAVHVVARSLYSLPGNDKNFEKAQTLHMVCVVLERQIGWSHQRVWHQRAVRQQGFSHVVNFYHHGLCRRERCLRSSTESWRDFKEGGRKCDGASRCISSRKAIWVSSWRLRCHFQEGGSAGLTLSGSLNRTSICLHGLWQDVQEVGWAGQPPEGCAWQKVHIWGMKWTFPLIRIWKSTMISISAMLHRSNKLRGISLSRCSTTHRKSNTTRLTRTTNKSIIFLKHFIFTSIRVLLNIFLPWIVFQ